MDGDRGRDRCGPVLFVCGGVGDVGGIDLDVVLELVEVGVGGRGFEGECIHDVSDLVGIREAMEGGVDLVEEVKTGGSVFPVAVAAVGDDVEVNRDDRLADSEVEVLPRDVRELDEYGRGVEWLLLLGIGELVVEEVHMSDERLALAVQDGEEGVLNGVVDDFTHGINDFNGLMREVLQGLCYYISDVLKVFVDDVVADYTDARVVAKETASGDGDGCAYLGEGDGVPHLSFFHTPGVGLRFGGGALLGIGYFADELVVAVPGVFFHFGSDLYFAAVVVDGGIGFGG